MSCWTNVSFWKNAVVKQTRVVIQMWYIEEKLVVEQMKAVEKYRVVKKNSGVLQWFQKYFNIFQISKRFGNLLHLVHNYLFGGNFHFSTNLYIYTLLVCLFVRLFPKDVKTTDLIGLKIFKIVSKSFWFL